MATRFGGTNDPHEMEETMAAQPCYTPEQLKSIFTGSVSDKNLAKILAIDPPLSAAAQEREITMFFSDVRDFTGVVRERGGETTRKAVSSLLDGIAAEAAELGGYVDKYVGDEVMVFFGAPVEMALEDQALAAASLGLMAQHLGNAADLVVGVGINTGPSTVGNYGGELKPNYTPVGATVNIAARMEGLSKMSGDRPTMPSDIAKRINGKFRTVFVQTIAIRKDGAASATVDVDCIVGAVAEIGDEQTALWDRYDGAVRMVAEGNPGAAVSAFADMAADHPGDALFQTALDRARTAYAEASARRFAKCSDLSQLGRVIGESVTRLFGDRQIALLEQGIEGVWRFVPLAGLSAPELVYAPSGAAIAWLRGLDEASLTEEAPEPVTKVDARAVVPLSNNNELVGALFVDCPETTDLSSLTVLGRALSGPWLDLRTKDLRSRYQEKIDDAQKLEELNRELESKSFALEKSLEENKELNRTLEARVAEHARRLERAASLKRYLPPSVVEEIIDGGRDLAPRTERRKITVMFSDVHGFTSSADGLEPEELARLLNHYLSAMSEIAFRAGATIDKFRGDGMMVFFGAPQPMGTVDGAKSCLAMGIEMCRRVAELKNEWFNDGYDWDLGIRMGINTGYATVGEFGSRDRLDYTAIGTEVTIAARLETACETDSILVSHATWALVRDDFPCEPVGPLELKGIHRPIRAYRVDWDRE